MIKIITVGEIKESYLKEAIEEYKKRLQKYTKIEIIEVKDEGLLDIERGKKIEGEKILKNIQDKDYLITLEIEGKELDSLEFSKKIENTLMAHSNITFIIGGSNGLDQSIKALSNYSLSFCNKNCFNDLWNKIQESIISNRIFCRKFFWSI